MQIHRRTSLKSTKRVDPEQNARVEMSHTPSGWVPANQRRDHIDPLARTEQKARDWREQRKAS